MRGSTRFMFSILAIALLLSIASAQNVVGKASIRAPAVIIGNNTGSLTTISLTVTTAQGKGSVFVSGPQIVGNSTTQSALIAAQYASAYLGMNASKYTFNYSIMGAGNNVSGPSGGAAMTLLAISALSGKKLLTNFTETGTISSNGTIGPVGGVYDKAQAAKQANMSFILVPKVQQQSFDSETYLLIQDTLQIPLVPVANVSTALKFAFNYNRTRIISNQTNYTFFYPINVVSLPTNPVACTNGCNSTLFTILANQTLAFTNSSINQFATNPNFKNIGNALHNAIAQDRALAAKYYLYAAANYAFQTYIDSFFLNQRYVTIQSGLIAIQTIGGLCTSIPIPTLTSSNYEYLIGGELRQSWGLYTSNSSLAVYNSSIETTDGILYVMRSSAAAAGWCNAAKIMYNIAASSGNGKPVMASQNLSNIAYARISRAAQYGQSMYLNTAQAAYNVNNYPLAILDADYGYSISNASASAMPTGQLLNYSNALSRNSTFGVWATQYANEAQMYITIARQSNASAARSYATSAYTAALIASTFNKDMALISSNLVPGSSTQRLGVSIINATNSTTTTNPFNTFTYILQTARDIYAIVLVLLVVSIVAFALILYMLLPIFKAAKIQLRVAKPPNKRRR